MRRALLAVLLGAPLAGCTPDAAPPRSSAVPVLTEAVQQGPADQVLTATGEVQQPDEARIGAEVGGTVERVPGRIGTAVCAGEDLVVLDDRPMQLALQTARARLAQSQAALEARRVSRERVRLRAAGVLAVAAENQGAVSGTEAEIARLDMREADAQVAAAEADTQAAEAAVSNAELDVRRTRITAPFDGVVRELYAVRGQRIGVGAALVTVLGRGALEVLTDLPATGAAPGQTVEIGTPPQQQVSGTVAGVVPGLTAARTQRVRVVVPEPPDWLLPGSVLPVRIVVGHADAALSVPRDAVGGGAVFVVRDGTAHRVPVTVRWTSEDRVVVDGALSAGDAVVVRGNEALTDGAAVADASGAAPKPAAAP